MQVTKVSIAIYVGDYIDNGPEDYGGIDVKSELIRTSQIFYNSVSTHLLTVLTTNAITIIRITVILKVEQKIYSKSMYFR